VKFAQRDDALTRFHMKVNAQVLPILKLFDATVLWNLSIALVRLWSLIQPPRRNFWPCLKKQCRRESLLVSLFLKTITQKIFERFETQAFLIKWF